MADVTISDLPTGTPSTLDVIPFSTGTVTNKVSVANLKTALQVPAAQVNSDWNATSGVAQILNKPTINTAQLAKAWVNFNGTTGTTVGTEFQCTIRSQYNVSKVVRTGTGAYVIYFTTPMSNTSYSVGGTAFSATAGNGTKKPSTISVDAVNTTTCSISLGYPNVYNECAFIPLNSATICIQIYGN